MTSDPALSTSHNDVTHVGLRHREVATLPPPPWVGQWLSNFHIFRKS